MSERRTSKRWKTSDYSREKKKYSGKFFSIHNGTDNEFVGYLIDISSEGMMILSKRVFPEGEALRLRINLPQEIKGSDELMVEARSVWCERDTNPEYHRIGFSFTFTFPHHNDVIELLFKEEEKAEQETEQQAPTATE